MVFWRNKKNQGKNDEERRDQRVLHHSRDADIEPPTEYDADLNPEQKHAFFEETEMEILEDMEDIPEPMIKKN